MVQILVENGHSWSNIKTYTLSEIGAFLRVILKRNGPDKADKLTLMWLAQHLEHKGLKEFTKELQKQGLSKEVKKKTEQQEIQSNWHRLKAFMGGRR